MSQRLSSVYSSNWPKVCIVVLHWKNYESTRDCLESLGAITYPHREIVVVDNHSEDGSIERLQIDFPHCYFLLNDANLGFARGCNVGIRFAYAQGAHYVLLLNNDIRVTPGFLEPAVCAAESDPRVGLVTGKVLYLDPPNMIWHAGGYIHPIKRNAITRGFREIDRGQYDKVCETKWATGAMMLIKRSVLETVGFLPEEYFFGVEEWDYSTAVRKAGFKILYVPEFKAYHNAGASYPAGHPVLIVYNGVRNKMIYNQKYMPRPLFLLWRLFYWMYLQVWWPRRAWWGCQNEEDYRVRLMAARLAFKDHKGIQRIELKDLEEAARRLGPTPTWGSGWHPKAETKGPSSLER